MNYLKKLIKVIFIFSFLSCSFSSENKNTKTDLSKIDSDGDHINDALEILRGMNRFVSDLPKLDVSLDDFILTVKVKIPEQGYKDYVFYSKELKGKSVQNIILNSFYQKTGRTNFRIFNSKAMNHKAFGFSSVDEMRLKSFLYPILRMKGVEFKIKMSMRMKASLNSNYDKYLKNLNFQITNFDRFFVPKSLTAINSKDLEFRLSGDGNKNLLKSLYQKQYFSFELLDFQTDKRSLNEVLKSSSRKTNQLYVSDQNITRKYFVSKNMKNLSEVLKEVLGKTAKFNKENEEILRLGTRDAEKENFKFLISAFGKPFRKMNSIVRIAEGNQDGELKYEVVKDYISSGSEEHLVDLGIIDNKMMIKILLKPIEIAGRKGVIAKPYRYRHKYFTCHFNEHRLQSFKAGFVLNSKNFNELKFMSFLTSDGEFSLFDLYKKKKLKITFKDKNVLLEISSKHFLEDDSTNNFKFIIKGSKSTFYEGVKVLTARGQIQYCAQLVGMVLNQGKLLTPDSENAAYFKGTLNLSNQRMARPSYSFRSRRLGINAKIYKSINQ